MRVHEVRTPRRQDLDADDGRGPRRPAHPRPRRRQELVLRHRGGAEPTATASTRSTCPGFGSSCKPVDGAVHGPLVRRRPSSTSWTRWASSAPTSSATRWAAAWRSRSACATPSASRGARAALSGRRVHQARLPPDRPAAAPRVRRPAAPLHPRDGRGPVLVDVPRPRRGRPERRRRRRRRVPAHLRLAPAPASRSSSSARNIYLDKPFGRGGFYPRLSELAAPVAVRLGHARPAHPARASSATSRRWLPRAEQIVLENCGHVPQVERPEQVNAHARAASSRASTRSASATRRVRLRRVARHGTVPRRWPARPRARRATGTRATSGCATRSTARRRRPEDARRRAPRPARARWCAPSPAQVTAPHPDRRPRRARPRLHPRAPARRCGCCPACTSAARSAGWATSPRTGPVLLVGNHSGGNLTRRQRRLHARASARTSASSARSTRSPTTSSSRCPASASCASTASSPPRRATPRRRSSTGAAVLVYPGGDHEVHRPSWERNRVDFGERKGWIRLALEQDVPIVPVVAIGGQETALFLSRGETLAKLLLLDKTLRLKVLPISLAAAVGPERRRLPRPPPAAGEDHRRDAAADPPARGVRRRARRRRGLRPRHRG